MRISTASILILSASASSAFVVPSKSSIIRETSLMEQNPLFFVDEIEPATPAVIVEEKAEAPVLEKKPVVKKEEPVKQEKKPVAKKEKSVKQEKKPVAKKEKPVKEETPAPEAVVLMSKSLPFMERPSVLTGELAGDVGFDPFGFAKSSEDLMNYREAEIKHSRLAMLAAAGWPLSEVLDKKIASLFGWDPLLDSTDRVELGKVSLFYWGAIVIIAAYIDTFGYWKSQRNEKDYFPGNLGWDPLSVYPKDEAGQLRMQLAEIKHGRLAMIATLGFATQEYVSKIGVVDETPFFFYPVSQTMSDVL
eukprot:CAMPEP_0178946638 /NCGR_PEP_ID=MMETSP0789-20121207/4398_1 /TAXON_ID=3005 /ORGANISM="Rhizosolenia setigera, Strain CCMP 1694" /LENGTH=304 /DNA_ID=CAMNT_0020626655 /DNA_START=662 /DNA_END=1576 /DNA_ORIENTATION=+